jgi:hypothetical protein
MAALPKGPGLSGKYTAREGEEQPAAHPKAFSMSGRLISFDHGRDALHRD